MAWLRRHGRPPGPPRGITRRGAAERARHPLRFGDPLLIGAERVRELPGFRFEVELRRRAGATLAKSLLPIGLMTPMMFASPWFPRPWCGTR